MVIEKEWADLTQWAVFSAAFVEWLRVVALLTLMLLAIAVLFETVRGLADARTLAERLSSPLVAIFRVARGLGGFVAEILQLPFGWRRTWAIASMTVKETIRRGALYAIGFFLAPLLFVGWFLSAEDEGRLSYLVSFVWTSSSYLLFFMVLFLVAMSIPGDIQNKTIHTVVTKPVRRTEIVLGRILGFAVVFTGILAFMSLVGYAFIEGQIARNARVETVDVGLAGVRIPILAWDVPDAKHVARRPIYASRAPNRYTGARRPEFLFRKKGEIAEKGVHVGREWSYRSHIEGETSDAAFWFFQLDPDAFRGAEQLRVEMTFDIFKTTKGNPTRSDDESSGVFCLLEFFEFDEDRPEGATTKPVYSTQFRVEGNRVTALSIPIRGGSGGAGAQAQANGEGIPFEALERGNLLVQAQCMTRNQFLGMAKHDLYFLPDEGVFEWNYAKGMFSLWLQVMFLLGIAVAASTFVNGFVAVLATVLVYVVGLCHDWVMSIAQREVVGGGPFESFIRLIGRRNLVSEIEPGFSKTMIDRIDPALEQVLGAVGAVVPNLTDVWTTTYVAEGYDIPMQLLARNALLIAGYLAPAVVVGCLLFRARETSS